MSPTTLTPWGYYKTILEYPYTKVKMILVKPEQILSYQYHYKRSEVWTIVQGTAKIKINGINYVKKVGDVIEISKKAKHQIGNIGKEDLVFIEVQLGEYFGEDDIVRLKDKYGRV